MQNNAREVLAKRYGLNASSPTTRQLLDNLDSSVSQYISRFRRAGVRREFPSDVLNKTVRKALESGDSYGTNAAYRREVGEMTERQWFSARIRLV